MFSRSAGTPADQPEKGEKVVAIRGLDEELYKQLLSASKTQGRNVSELANEALSRYLRTDEDQLILAEGTNYLEVTNDLLSVAKKPVLFRSINRLRIGPDLDENAISKISRIESCYAVSFPRSLSIQILEKCRNCSKLVPFEEGEDEVNVPRDAITFSRWRGGRQSHDRSMVSHLDRLILNRDQLAQFDDPVTFRKIGELRLEDDVTKEDVRRHVRKFEKVVQLHIPETLYPWIYIYCYKCESVTPH